MHDSQRQVNITNIHSVLIRCSFISFSYLNGNTSDAIYSFSPNRPPKSLLSIKLNQMNYIRMSQTESIPSITMRVTHQDRRHVDFNGKKTTFLLHIKTMQPIKYMMLYRRYLSYRMKIIGGSLLCNLWDAAKNIVKTGSKMVLNTDKDYSN